MDKDPELKSWLMKIEISKRMSKDEDIWKKFIAKLAEKKYIDDVDKEKIKSVFVMFELLEESKKIIPPDYGSLIPIFDGISQDVVDIIKKYQQEMKRSGSKKPEPVTNRQELTSGIGWEMEAGSLQRKKRWTYSDITLICSRLQKKFGDEKPEVIAVESIGKVKKKVDILCLSEARKEPSIQKIEGCHVKFMNPKHIDEETRQLQSKEQNIEYQLSKEDMDRAAKVIKCHSSSLFKKHSNLNFITMDSYISKEGGTFVIPGLCIVFYCTAKGLRPLHEDTFPQTLSANESEIPVDVREGYCKLASAYKTASSTNFHEKMKMGCAFSVRENELIGTIGPFLKKKGEKVAFLTCYHTTYDAYCDKDHEYEKLDEDEEDLTILQPPGHIFLENDQERQIGRVLKAIYSFEKKDGPGVDAAIVEITRRTPGRGEFAVNDQWNLESARLNDLPIFEGDVATCPDPKDTVVKFGARTHATAGRIKSTYSCAEFDKNVQFEEQIEIKSKSSDKVFAERGDSGAGVFQIKDPAALKLLGLLVAVTSYGTAIVTPINAILNKFGLTPEDFNINHV